MHRFLFALFTLSLAVNSVEAVEFDAAYGIACEEKLDVCQTLVFADNEQDNHGEEGRPCSSNDCHCHHGHAHAAILAFGETDHIYSLQRPKNIYPPFNLASPKDFLGRINRPPIS